MSQSELSFHKLKVNRENLKVRKYIQATKVNTDRLDNKQMLFQILPDRRWIGTNLIFQRYRFTKNGKTNKKQNFLDLHELYSLKHFLLILTSILWERHLANKYA